ncbi:hypothetical protein AVEN_24859-1 [Araneus ventricosus]|uniref:Uncharacterized protein n=1 Tax=Araneus ventricosus TaxID=182803 RepID=A0A4Y2BTU9_ARAVE|nr:hypothetical protein AVEN_24859-1 [Araneus ventricosus]
MLHSSLSRTSGSRLSLASTLSYGTLFWSVSDRSLKIRAHFFSSGIPKRAIHRCSKLEFLEHWKEKSIVKVEKPMKFGANGFEVVEFKRTRNPKLHPPIPIWDLDARLAGEQRICLHWYLTLRLEMKLEIPRIGEEE